MAGTSPAMTLERQMSHRPFHPRGPAGGRRGTRNDDVSCASFPPMTTQGIARSIHLFRKVVRSALIGVHSLDQIDVGRANFLFGRSRLQTENLQRSGDAHALVANGLPRLPTVW